MKNSKKIQELVTSFSTAKMNLSVNGLNETADFWFTTNDRGPRTDHGGGSDGESWMSTAQIEKVAAPYIKKWEPAITKMVKAFKLKGYKTEGYVDYGEKGHISIIFNVIAVIKKSKKVTDKKVTDKKVTDKKIGIIASILEFVSKSKNGETKATILSKLTQRFPERDAKAMTKTINCQLGGKKSLTRMETEKKVKLEKKENKKGDMTFKLK